MKKTIQERIFEAMQKYNGEIAVETDNKNFTFDEIDRDSGSIARWISDNAIQKETFIGIYCHSRINLIRSIIGILKAGCVFVPLDPSYPLPRLESSVQTTQLKWIFCDQPQNNALGNNKILQNLGVQWVPLEEALKTAQSSINPVEYTPEDKIYIYFTSGSTGLPKAIVGKNAGLRHFIDWEIDTFSIPPRFRVSQLTAPGFDAFLRDLLVPLCSGGTLCIPPTQDGQLDAGLLSRWIHDQHLDLVHCVPSIFRLFNSDLNPSLYPSLKYVLLSGERVHPSDLAEWYKNFDDRIEVVNLYGPTETTMIKTFYRVKPADLTRERIPIGEPMKGSRVIILNDDMKVCDELMAGEIYIRTPYRTYGYFNDEAMNRVKFIPNPLNNDPADLVFKTGDIGRYLPGGCIDLVGRKDRQVKIRGVRVELEEIENIILHYPNISEAVVIKKENASSPDILCAYAVLSSDLLNQSNSEDIADLLRRYVADNVPAYMVPDFFTILEKIPRNPNGKVDWNALPEPYALQSDILSSYTMPRDYRDRQLAGIWSRVLGIDEKWIGIDTNFFQLGGQSLKATTMLAQIHKLNDVRIPLGDLFKNPTIRGLSQYIEQAEIEKIPPLEPVEERDYYPIFSAQQRLYIVQQMNPLTTAYNIPSLFQFEGDTDPTRIETIFNRLIHRHESLRTYFIEVNGNPVRRILPPGSVDFKIQCYEMKDTDESPSSYVNGFFSQPFDLSRAPLLRVSSIKSDQNRFILAVDMHHIISDGISMEILTQEFIRLSEGKELLPLTVQYKDFVQWQDRQRSGILEKQEKYWLSRFEGDIPQSNLPTDYPYPSTLSFEGRRFFFEIPKELTFKVRELVKSTATTLHQFLIAVYNILLSRYTGQDDIVIGYPITGRSHPDVQQVIGMFVNMICLRNRPSHHKTAIQFLAEVKENVLQAHENQDYPFDELIARLGIQRKSNRNPLFDAAFSLFTPDAPKVDNFNWNVNDLSFDKNASMFDLTLRAVENPETIYMVFEYKTCLFKPETIEKLSQRYIEIMEQVADAPTVQLKEITIAHEFTVLKPDILDQDENDFRF